MARLLALVRAEWTLRRQPRDGNWISPQTHLAGTVLNALESLAVPARYEHGEAVYRCNDPVVCWYRIVAGAARKCAYKEDSYVC